MDTKAVDQLTKEYTNDAPEKVAAGSIKYDGGKPPIFRGAISYFPRAISAVAGISAFGASKYAWKGWEGVTDGFNRYSDAMVRHLTYEGQGEVLDPDSGLLHAAHAAWNALARLELLMKEQEEMALWTTSPEADEIVEQINGSHYLQPNT
jgi:hypothetical protein